MSENPKWNGAKGISLFETGIVYRCACIVFAFGFVVAMFTVITHGLARVSARKGTTEGYRKAVAWDPRNGRYHAQLARALQYSLENVDLGEVVERYEQAAALAPRDAALQAELGAAYEWAGRAREAQQAWERAHDLFPNSPEISWKLANFYFRSAENDRAYQALRQALVSNPALRRAAFDLAWRATGDARRILVEGMPADAEVYFAYLAYLGETNRPDAAAQAWMRLLELQLAFEPSAAFPYLDMLLQSRRVEDLDAAWEALAERYPAQIRSRRDGKNLILNGSFEGPMINGGLDWRIGSEEGVEVAVDDLVFFDGAHSLRVSFDGQHNFDFHHIYQFIPVQPGTKYRFTAFVRAEGLTSDSGPRLELIDAFDYRRFATSAPATSGTTQWTAQEIVFTAPPATRLIFVRLARPPSRKLANHLSGRVWLDRVSLTAAR